MKLSHLLLTTSLCAVAALPAAAQGKPFSTVDSDGNGSLSKSELEAAFGSSSAARILAKGDQNRDGSISLSEARISDDDESDDDENDRSDSDENDESDDDQSDENDESDDDQSDESDDDENDESDDDESDRSSDRGGSDDDEDSDESDDGEDSDETDDDES